MNENKTEDITIFTAGLDSEGEVWAESVLGKVSYEQYLQMVEMLLTDLYTGMTIEKTDLQEDLHEIIEQLEPLPDANHDHTH